MGALNRGGAVSGWDSLSFIMARMREEDRGHSTPCWVWSGYRNEKGYGRSYVPGLGNNIRIHRATYSLLVGPIPNGLTIDHLCGVKPCVNPAHLEAVTDEENKRRAGLIGPEGKCLHGHSLAKYGSARGCRKCLAAQAATPEVKARRAKYMREWTARNRERVNEQRRIFRLANRDAINARRREVRAAKRART